MMLAFAAVITTAHMEGDALPGGGDYIDVPFAMPAGCVEIQVTKSYTNQGANILDFGLWAPDGYRGWSGGLLDDIIVGVDQSSRGYLPGALPAGTYTVAIGKAQLIDTGSHYTIDITCRDNATLTLLPKAAFAPVVLDPTRRWFKGDFHVHSSQSGDSKAAMADDVALAHQRGLDFINLSDHNTIAQHALIAAQQASWPVLVLRGSEITTYSGHGNGVGIHDYVDHRIGHAGRTMQNVVDDVSAQGGIFLINHPATNVGNLCIGCQWQHADDIPWDEVAGLEVLTSGYDIAVRAFTPQILQMWDGLEDQGFRLSAVTGSDDHSAGVNESSIGAPIGSPCTAVLADELSEAAIVDGVKNHHTLAQLRGPDDPFVDFTIGTLEIGDEGKASNAAIHVHVAGASGYFIEIIRDGAQLAMKPVDSDDFTLAMDDGPKVGATTRYRVQLLGADGSPVVITSHIYIDGVAGAGGCSAGGGAGWLIALLVLTRARGRRS